VLHIAVGLRHWERRKDDWNEMVYLKDELVAGAVARQLASSSERGKNRETGRRVFFFFTPGGKWERKKKKYRYDTKGN
jgi:hypothetical protein